MYLQPAILQAGGTNCGHSEIPIPDWKPHQSFMPGYVGGTCWDWENIRSWEHTDQAGR